MTTSTTSPGRLRPRTLVALLLSGVMASAVTAGIVLAQNGAPEATRVASGAPAEPEPVATTQSIAPAAVLANAEPAPLPPVPIVLPEPAPGPKPASVILPDSQSPDVAAIRDAVTAYRKADIATGDRIRARFADSPAGTLLEWAALRFGGPQVEFDRLTAFLRLNPDWTGAAWVRRRAEDVLVAERKPPEAVRAFFATERPQTPGGKLALAMAFRADGLRDDAASLVRDAWRSDNFGRELEARFLAEFPDVLGTADHRFRMERLLFKENWEGARRSAEYAGKGYDALVKARIAVTGKASGAAKLLDAVPAGLKLDTSFVFSRVQFLRNADKAQEAAKALENLSRDPAVLGDGDEWWVERRLVARKLLDAGDAKTAYAVASQHGAAANEKRIEAEFHSGWIALRFLHDAALAARHFGRAAEIAATPISVARAAYWQGRAAEAAGSADEARGFFERAAKQGITYYGQLAGGKLGIGHVALRTPLDPAAPDRIAAARAPGVQAIGLLYAAGFRDVAAMLIADLSRRGRNVPEIEAVGELALAYRDARSLLVLGKGATQRGLPLDEQAFPTIGVPAFETVARVEPAMVHAIARQESAFDPAAGSSVGARGLMQLMPATAQATARKVGLEFDLSRLVDASYNARLGSAHLGELMESWKGSYILTFASYNAGPGNVRKWIDAYGDPRKSGVDPIDWVERIPFSETRNYVQRVMENMQVYRRRLGERSALLIDSDLKGGSQIP